MDRVAQSAQQWRRLHPELPLEAFLVVARVQRLWALWDERLRVPFARAGLHAGDFDVLAALRRADEPMLPGDLARAMLVTAGATTKRVDRLAAAGLAERVAGSGDGRRRPVRLTAEGATVTDDLMRAHLANEAALLAPLSPAEREQLAALLSRLLAAAER